MEVVKDLNNQNRNSISEVDQLNIKYYTDPLCCWSWVFEPVWQKIKTDLAPILTYQYCMGGMISSWDNYHDALNSVSKPIQMGPVWLQAKHLSGTFINDKIWFADPPASSYPACAAVKCAALQSPAAEEMYLYKVREAALVQGKNTAKKEVLLEIARELGTQHPDIFNAATFETLLTSDEVIRNFRSDLQEISYRGITRFPSLLISIHGQKECVMLTGSRPYESVLDTIESLTQKVKQ